MTTLHLVANTPVAPEQIINALTDFSPRRLQTWPNIDQRYYQVHAVNATSADVTEGSDFFGGVWERSLYDWSRPDYVTITVQSSNAFATGSFWEYHITANGKGGSRVELTLRRIGKSLKGRVLATMLRVFGRRIFRQDLDQTLQRLAAATPTATLAQ